jgi:hypothetical protein
MTIDAPYLAAFAAMEQADEEAEYIQGRVDGLTDDLICRHRWDVYPKLTDWVSEQVADIVCDEAPQLITALWWAYGTTSGTAQQKESARQYLVGLTNRVDAVLMEEVREEVERQIQWELGEGYEE